jgi:hypothetical protein
MNKNTINFWKSGSTTSILPILSNLIPKNYSIIDMKWCWYTHPIELLRSLQSLVLPVLFFIVNISKIIDNKGNEGEIKKAAEREA